LQRGQSLFWVLAAALVVLVLVTLRQLPPVVASHFDAAGVPNGWSARPTYAVLLITVGAVLPLGILGLVHALTRRGPELLNIPARGFWTRPEHRDEAVRRVRAYMWWLGSILTAAALAIHALILRAHTSSPPHLSTAGIWLVLGGIILMLGLWTAGWYRLLRPPSAH
jgi:uncharacterized membrane protein